MKRSSTEPRRRLIAVLVALCAMAGGCNKEKAGLQRAAAIVCQAARAGLDPPEEAYKRFAARMKVDLSDVRTHAKHAVGTQVFADRIEAGAAELPASARRKLGEMMSAIVGGHPQQWYELLRSGFSEHGVTLDCPELKRYYER